MVSVSVAVVVAVVVMVVVAVVGQSLHWTGQSSETRTAFPAAPHLLLHPKNGSRNV